MRRLQIMIDEDVDDALARRAREEGTSKAALIRRYVRQHIEPAPPLDQDPFWDFFAKDRGSPKDSTSVDDVVYPR